MVGWQSDAGEVPAAMAVDVRAKCQIQLRSLSASYHNFTTPPFPPSKVLAAFQAFQAFHCVTVTVTHRNPLTMPLFSPV